MRFLRIYTLLTEFYCSLHLVRAIACLTTLFLVGCKSNPIIRLAVLDNNGIPISSTNDKVTARVIDSAGDTLSSEITQTSSIGLQGIGSQLFSDIDLDPDKLYQLELSVDLSASGSTACPTRNRLIGRSRPFSQGIAASDVDIHITIQLRCADESEDLLPLDQGRIYHTATWIADDLEKDAQLSASDVRGSVWVIGGARTSTNLLLPKPADILGDVEVITFSPPNNTSNVQTVSRSLSTITITPRAAHSANRVSKASDETIIVAGGYTTMPSGLGHTLIAQNSVEELTESAVTELSPMQIPRAAHGSLLVGPQDAKQLLFVKGVGQGISPPYLASYESYDPNEGKSTSVTENIDGVGRIFPHSVVTPNDDIIIIGGLWKRNESVPNESVRLAPAPCALDTPCLTPLPGFPIADGRISSTATYVPCENDATSGAIYVTGGSYVDELLQIHLGDDIYCIDTERLSKPPKRIGRLGKARANHTATILHSSNQSRRLFVAGGPDANGGELGDASADIFPVTCTCDDIPPEDMTTVPLKHRRILHTATRLPDGSVLLIGGRDTATIERFYPDM